MNPKDLVRAGMIAGLVMTVGMMLARAIEVTPMNFELALGAILTTQLDALAWLVGFGMHLVISVIVAFAYVRAFKMLGRANALVGVELGIVHWAVSGAAMGAIPRLFSLVPGLVEPPGYFGLNFGIVNFFANLLVHLGFGAVIGSLYAAAAGKAQPARPPLVITPAEPVPRKVSGL